MFKKRIIALALTGAIALSLVACGGAKPATPAAPAEEKKTEAPAAPAAPTDEKKPEEPAAPPAEAKTEMKNEDIHVAFVVKSLSDQFYILVKAGAEQKAKELGVKLTFIAPNAESDVQGQVDMLENMVSQGVSAICVAPSSADAPLPTFKKATEKGIPVLMVDTDSTYENKLTFIGTGNEAAAELGGKYAGEKLGTGKKAVILRGRLGDPNHDAREAGFRKGLEAAGFEVLAVEPADSEAEKGLNVTQDLIQKFDNIDVICCTADSMAQGAQRAVEAAGKMDKIQVLGFDGTLPVVEMTIQGKFLGSIAQNPYNMGVLGVENAVKAAKGEMVEKRIDTGAQVIDKDNGQAFLDDLNKKLGK